MKKYFKRKSKVQKYDRRRALKCELLKKSDTHTGYCKYMVTIGEKDGTVHKKPAYGTDMQDALSRLINTERTVKVEKKLENNVGIIALIWMAIIGWPSLLIDSSSPYVFFYGMGTLLVSFFIAAWWYWYIKRGQ